MGFCRVEEAGDDMGVYTALNDAQVDTVVEAHMQKVVESIRSNMEPDAVLLRGSFGRGEGSVMVENGQLRFLSDYEINVSTFSPFHRRFFARLATDLSTQFGIETSIVWMRPDVFYKLRIGPFTAGSPPITISLYETRYGSKILYGRDLLADGPVIDAQQIAPSSGIQLVLNRMAEALQYIPPSNECAYELTGVIWLNKLILACIESLLVVWGQYHFSYEERGRRFSVLAKRRLDFMRDGGQSLLQFAERAVEFKLRPSRGLYPEQLQETAYRVIQICDQVFRYLLRKDSGISFDSYTEFPEKYLQYKANGSTTPSFRLAVESRLLDIYKYVRKGKLPSRSLWSYSSANFVYSVVPLLFVSCIDPDRLLPSLSSAVRRNLSKVCDLVHPVADARREWKLLNEKMFWAWKNFC